MRCLVCDVPLTPRRQWDKGVRPEGHRSHGGRGLCPTHYARERYRSLHPRSIRSRQEVLEDYMLIRDEVSSIAQAADRMGMTASALEKALERARKQGVTEAQTPNQLRGEVYNQHFDRRRSA